MTKEAQQIYWIWADMIQRCTNPKHPAFGNYGGRGITVSDEWRQSTAFLADMVPRPPGGSLDRIDNNKGYSKENCRWTDRQVQNLNKRIYKTNHFGISGVEPCNTKFKVRVRCNGKIVVNVTVSDFFEACCIRKSAERELFSPILRRSA
jgi:hypothetical protein